MTDVKNLNRQNKKVILFDIEATNLAANFGYILCISMKELGKKGIKTFSIDDYPEYKRDPTNDKRMVQDAAAELQEAGAWITWYGQRFDVPFINTRLVGHGLAPMANVPHIDGWRIAKYKMRLNSNRLASVCSFLDVGEKTPLNGPIWIKASAGDPKALQYVKKHCAQDVLVLEEAYERIRPLITGGVNLSLLVGETGGVKGCPICGSTRRQARGYRVGRVVRYQRYQCQGCGGWYTGRGERIVGADVQ